jgi:YVTN family beta-propeller protein
VAVSPVTNQVYVADRTSNNVTVIDGTDNNTVTVDVGTSPRAAAVNPVTSSGHGMIVLQGCSGLFRS